MAIRVGINGFGRIGRLVFRAMVQRRNFEIVCINDLSEPKTLASLLARDSVHGKFKGTVKVDGENMIVNGKPIRCTKEKDPAALPWKAMNVDFVVEATGVFRKREQIEKHFQAGAPKVLLTVDAKDAIDATIVMGVNDNALKPEAKIISNATCTTNCLAPLAKIMHEAFGIEKGLMTTIHAYTNDQRLQDLIHEDLRRARAAALNIIPTTTGAARSVGKVLKALEGKLNGIALRVPVADGSVVDLTFDSTRPMTVDAINAAVKAAAEGPLKGIVEYSDEELVSSVIIGNPHSCVFDSKMTMVMGDRQAKVIAWYDNEWGYSNRVVDVIELAVKVSGK